MNIRDYWPSDPQIFRGTYPTWDDIFARRSASFLGFLEVEGEKGFLKPSSIHLSQTQDMVRILLFRTLEEFGEALSSDSIDHHREEIIDALNFLYAIYFLDTTYLDRENIFEEMILISTEDHFRDRVLNVDDLGQITLYCSEFGDYLRNRSWMNQPQDLYFNGSLELVKLFRKITLIAFGAFESFDQFYRFYVAKDDVLQFRIRSKY